MADVLVLGGGGFLGYHVVAAAQSAGHAVTVLSRSGTPPRDGVEVVRGDREGDIGALRGRRFDAAVDTYTDEKPGAPAVRRTAELLSGSIGCYCYVSGMSVYAPDGPAVPDEHAPVRRRGVEPDGDPLQARSLAKLDGEHAVGDAFDGPALFPRVGIMVGPRDPSARFTWWPMRFRRALLGDAPDAVTCPGHPDRPVQYSDARDIARWLVDAAVGARGGVFNTVGPLRDDPLADVLDACLAAAREATGSDREVTLRWNTEEEALRRSLAQVTEEDRPLWFPEDQIPQQAIDSRAAAAAGLTFRSAAHTAADTLAWTLQAGADPLDGFLEPG